MLKQKDFAALLCMEEVEDLHFCGLSTLAVRLYKCTTL